ncbi:MAG: hypothetical protein ACLPXB_00350 [Thiobacillaceae bacterium]
MARSKKSLERVKGTFSAIPHAVHDSVSLKGASHLARSLLLDVMRQLNGRNNGRLHLSTTWLKERGWASHYAIQKGKLELIHRGLIVKTRQGGLNAGPDLFALTWLQISDFAGLDIRKEDYWPGVYQNMEPPLLGQMTAAQKAARAPSDAPPTKPASVKRTAGSQRVKRESCPVHRDSAVPASGIVKGAAVPASGTKNADFEKTLSRQPETMNSCHIPPGGGGVGVARSGRKRIVGKPGRSGKPKPAPQLPSAAKAGWRVVGWSEQHPPAPMAIFR